MVGNLALHRLVVLGDGGVGKTALTVQVSLNYFDHAYVPTIEDSYRKQVQIDGQACVLNVLDTAGDEKYAVLRDQWISDGDGFVLVYSTSSRASFVRIEAFYRQILRVKESELESTFPDSPPRARPPIVLVGNKSDCDTEREVSTSEGAALARALGCHFFETSAKSCVNVDDAFYVVVRILRKRRHRTPRTEKEGRIKARRVASQSSLSRAPGREREPTCIIL
ncbi:ras small monomeric GTPase [Lineolata rhizophorae]|uniref:Ras small monomeric GTPase n=1 Tax=Lineolata rhizophorae TaxID=578093 RepID=A0A6A6NNX4_9PEZI|nr:ras small monomeric GTPase [Lineolata rhizophorae]